MFLLARRLVRPAEFLEFASLELLHAEDMLDPALGYRPDLAGAEALDLAEHPRGFPRPAVHDGIGARR